MRIRSAAILIQNDSIALIERHRAGLHYYTFPGGGTNRDETPEQAVIREVYEELGMEIRVLRPVVKLWFRGNPQFFHLVEQVGGEFGTGRGEEYSSELEPKRGTYHPLWMAVSEITHHNVLPKDVAALVRRSHPDLWPDKLVTMVEQTH